MATRALRNCGTVVARPVPLLEDVNPIAQTPSDLCGSFATRKRARAIPRTRIPERGATDGETDETFDACGSGKPASHPGFIGTPAQHDAANPFAPGAERYGQPKRPST